MFQQNERYCNVIFQWLRFDPRIMGSRIRPFSTARELLCVPTLLSLSPDGGSELEAKQGSVHYL